MSGRQLRTKACNLCMAVASTLFRVRLVENGDWLFACGDCLKKVKPDNDHYRYGGTWKSAKRN